MNRLLELIVGLFLPMERGVPNAPPPEAPDVDALLNDGTEPVSGTPAAEATPEQTPPTGTPEGAEARTDLAPDDETERLRARVQELEQKDQQTIRGEAESLLFEMLPELPEQIEENRRAREAITQPAAEPGLAEEAFGEEPSLEDRLAQIEKRQEQIELRRESDRLVNDLQRLKATRYPDLDVTQALQIIAQSGQREVNVEKVAEVVNNHAVQEHEAWLRRRMNDPAFVNTLVSRGGQPASAAPAAEAPPVPRQSGATPGLERPAPTYKNATKTLIERLRAKGWGQTGETPAQ